MTMLKGHRGGWRLTRGAGACREPLGINSCERDWHSHKQSVRVHAIICWWRA
jgi:hypothetical protein